MSAVPATAPGHGSPAVNRSATVDALIIGAGFTGLYQLWSLRKLGLNVRVVDAASDVGGTWYWNCYPGARTDSPSHIYQYWFSDELLADWDWKQRYVDHTESSAYFRHVADRFDLRRDITFNSRVDSARWDESARRWQVTTSTGETIAARFLITALGPLSAPVVPPFKGHDRFKGRLVHTARWPREGVDLKGKRVGVIGTGATGIQVIQTIAPEVAQLTVFQRTANYAVPMINPTYGEAERAAMRARYPQTREAIWTTFVGFDEAAESSPYFSLTPEQRRATLERLWADGSLRIWVAGFMELLTDAAVSEEISEFVREKIRARIRDPKLAAKLVPADHGFGTRRVPLENGYFDVYNRDNVSLVDVKAAPIVEFTEKGLRTTEAEYELDIIVTATGFDALTGALNRIDIEGVNHRTLKDKWADGPTSYLGSMVAGFPNFFMIHGPMAPGAQAQMITTGEWQVDWTAGMIEDMDRDGKTRIEATEAGEQSWAAELNFAADQTLHKLADSWYNAKNIEGKKGGFMIYVGGFPRFRQVCEESVEQGYKGFIRS